MSTSCTFQICNRLRMTDVGVPTRLDTGCLPTKKSIFNHHLKIREEGVEEGRWKENTPVSQVCKTTFNDVKTQWEKTSIPSLFSVDPKKAMKMMVQVVLDTRSLLKLPIKRRTKTFGSDIEVLLDMAVCKHEDLETCSFKWFTQKVSIQYIKWHPIQMPFYDPESKSQTSFDSRHHEVVLSLDNPDTCGIFPYTAGSGRYRSIHDDETENWLAQRILTSTLISLQQIQSYCSHPVRLEGGGAFPYSAVTLKAPPPSSLTGWLQ